MKKKHYVKTIEDIKYCEENGIEIIENKNAKRVFEKGCWVYYLEDTPILYDVAIRIGDGLYYYEEQQEATEKDVGKLCLFWDIEKDKNDENIGVLRLLADATIPYSRKGGGIFCHCRPLTKEEIKEFMEKAE